MNCTILFNKYKIIKHVACGGTSDVYLAENMKLGSQLAIKRTRKDSSVINLLVEPGILKDLKHPGIPHIIDIEEDAIYLYIIEEYVEGITLRDYKLSDKLIDERTILKWGIQLCDILQYLHERNPPIIYRDLKPNNIMFMPNGNLKIIDFGIAREYKNEANDDTVLIGTRGYAAPEQYGIGQSDERTDIYSLGVTLYYLLTGKNLTDPPYKINPPLKQVSKELEQIIMKCTQLIPSKRYQSVLEMKEQLVGLLESTNIRYKTIYSNIEHKTVGILSLTRRSGSTFLATNLAKALTDYNLLISLIEVPFNQPYICDMVGLDQYAESKGIEFYSPITVIGENKEVARDKVICKDNIMFYCQNPSATPLSWDRMKTLKLIYSGRRYPVSIIDIGYNYDKAVDFINDLDLILVIFEATPPDLMNNFETLKRLQQLKLDGYNIEFILNRDNSGINKCELEKYMKITPLGSIPDIPANLIYKALYRNDIPYTYKKARDLLNPCLRKITSKILAKEFINHRKRRTKGLIGIWR